MARAMPRPQRPGTRPDGIGRSGSLIASTWRSHQSLAAWLMPQTIGPARSTPSASRPHSPSGETPDETAPQAKAHIGGNQVIGLISCSAAAGSGYCRGCKIPVTLMVSIRRYIARAGKRKSRVRDRPAGAIPAEGQSSPVLLSRLYLRSLT